MKKKYADRNAVGRANNNPIFDTRKYSIDFDDWEVSKLTENDTNFFDIVHLLTNNISPECILILIIDFV